MLNGQFPLHKWVFTPSHLGNTRLEMPQHCIPKCHVADWQRWTILGSIEPIDALCLGRGISPISPLQSRIWPRSTVEKQKTTDEKRSPSTLSHDHGKMKGAACWFTHFGRGECLFRHRLGAEDPKAQGDSQLRFWFLSLREAPFTGSAGVHLDDPSWNKRITLRHAKKPAICRCSLIFTVQNG